MAMLAEKKRRTKWAPNPQGKLWSNDSNKFGQKLLEKMGWSPGQGLGVQNQGVADVLRVQFKNDSKGLGFKENDEYWTKHQSEFSDFLLKLAEQSQTDETITPINLENKPLSLELKSSQSRSRIHYHKFTRGKDLSRYSEKDLAAILGTTAPKPDKAEEGTNKNHINAGSMTEYFKRKQYGFNSNDLDQDVNKSSTSEKESSIIENEAILCDTEVISNNFDVAVEDIDEEVVNEEVEVKKKKKKKKKRVLLNKELLNEGIEIDENINCESIDGNKCNFKKKRKSKTTCSEDNFETNQCTLEDKGNGIDMHENIVENLLTDSTKVRNVDDENIACDDFEKASEKTKINENKNKKANVNSSKRKKKSKDAIDFVADDNALDIKSPDRKKRKLDCTKKCTTMSMLDDEHISKKQKNKSGVDERQNTNLEGKSENTTEVLNNSNDAINSNDILIVNTERKCKQTKKLKKAKARSEYLEEEDEVSDPTKGEVARKKKSKDKINSKNDANNMCAKEDTNMFSDELHDVNIESEEKRPKKKSKRRKEESTVQQYIGKEVADHEKHSKKSKNLYVYNNTNEDNIESEVGKHEKIKVIEDTSCVISADEVISNNDKVKTKRKRKNVQVATGENRLEHDEVTATLSAGEDSIGFHHQNKKMYSNADSLEENCGFNSNNYKSYNNENAQLNQYSYNSVRVSKNFQKARGGMSRMKNESDVVSVKRYFEKCRLLVSEPPLNFKGSNVSQIKGYGN